VRSDYFKTSAKARNETKCFRVHLQHVKSGKIKNQAVLAYDETQAKYRAESINRNFKANKAVEF